MMQVVEWIKNLLKDENKLEIGETSVIKLSSGKYKIMYWRTNTWHASLTSYDTRHAAEKFLVWEAKYEVEVAIAGIKHEIEELIREAIISKGTSKS